MGSMERSDGEITIYSASGVPTRWKGTVMDFQAVGDPFSRYERVAMSLLGHSVVVEDARPCQSQFEPDGGDLTEEGIRLVLAGEFPDGVIRGYPGVEIVEVDPDGVVTVCMTLAHLKTNSVLVRTRPYKLAANETLTVRDDLWSGAIHVQFRSA